MQKERFNERAYEINFISKNRGKVVIALEGNYEILNKPKPLDFLYTFRSFSDIDFKLITFDQFVENWHIICCDEIEEFENILKENEQYNEESYSWIYQVLFKQDDYYNDISDTYFTRQTRAELSTLLSRMHIKLCRELIEKFNYTKHSRHDSNPIWNAPSLVWRAARFITSKWPAIKIRNLNDLPEEEFEKVVKKSKSLVLSDEKIMEQILNIVTFIEDIWNEKNSLNI